MKGGYVCLSFQPINVIMNYSNQLNNFWMFYSNINQKGPTSPIFLSKPLECKFVINKINLIVLINTFVWWKNPRL
jgi:hypothetical protein